MKKTTTITLALMLIASFSMAQTILAGWTLPTGTTADANTDTGLSINSGMIISTLGGTSNINFNKFGDSTFAAQASGWEGGANLKCWQIEINTTGYHHLKLNSKQTSGGNYPGPRDFNAQYRLGATGTWADIPNTTLITANNWTSAVLDSVDIPALCDNQSSVFIRWIMTSDTSSAPPALVNATGTSKIDDIFITGTPTENGINEIINKNPLIFFPNPCKDILFLNSENTNDILHYELVNPMGMLVLSGTIAGHSTNFTLKVSSLPRGVYFIRISNSKNNLVRKIIVE